jgi:uncharacterized protein
LSSLADRIRGIVAPQVPVPKRPGPPPDDGSADDHRGVLDLASTGPVLPEPLRAGDLEAALGGSWQDGCFTIDRRFAPAGRHGREAIGTFGECLDAASTQAALYAGAPASVPFVFLDLETTGLSGGAGTQAFLVGIAWFDADASFVTRQFLLTRFTDERQMLERVTLELARAGTIVSFNGKSFDAPMLETRYLFHRLATNIRALPHVDVLHPARRFWKPREAGGVASPFRAAPDPCSLVALEKQLLGVRRAGDVPGFEIPGRYFQFVRSGDARPLAAVVEHNRRDLLTLAALAARLFHLALHGPEQARDAREALALGHVYMRAGITGRACDAYAHAVDLTERGVVSQLVRVESLRALALSYRRAREHAAAARCWRRLLDTPGCPPIVAREATEALAVHHEHREHDFDAARTFALRSMELDAQPAWTRAVRHRLARLDRKLKLSGPLSSLLS